MVLLKFRCLHQQLAKHILEHIEKINFLTAAELQVKLQNLTQGNTAVDVTGRSLHLSKMEKECVIAFCVRILCLLKKGALSISSQWSNGTRSLRTRKKVEAFDIACGNTNLFLNCKDMVRLLMLMQDPHETIDNDMATKVTVFKALYNSLLEVNLRLS